MRKTWLHHWLWTTFCALVVIAQSGCNMSQLRHRMGHVWRGGIVGDDIGAVDSNDPWASRASQEMSAHHPPGYSDPSDRFFSSEQARAISRGLDGGR